MLLSSEVNIAMNVSVHEFIIRSKKGDAKFTVLDSRSHAKNLQYRVCVR